MQSLACCYDVLELTCWYRMASSIATSVAMLLSSVSGPCYHQLHISNTRRAMKRTFLLASVEAAVNLEQQFNDEMKQNECRHDPSRPRRHKRLVQIQTNEDRWHCKHTASSPQFLARDVIHTSRAYAMMSVSVCL